MKLLQPLLLACALLFCASAPVDTAYLTHPNPAGPAEAGAWIIDPCHDGLQYRIEKYGTVGNYGKYRTYFKNAYPFRIQVSYRVNANSTSDWNMITVPANSTRNGDWNYEAVLNVPAVRKVLRDGREKPCD